MCQVTIRLPGTLLQIVGGQSTVEVNGDTLRKALDDLTRARPELKAHLFDESGALRHNVLILYNGVHAGRRDSLDVPLQPRAEVAIVQAVSGG